MTSTTTDHTLAADTITPADVARELGLPAEAIRGWVPRGVIPGVRFGAGGRRSALAPRVISQLRREA